MKESVVDAFRAKAEGEQIIVEFGQSVGRRRAPTWSGRAVGSGACLLRRAG
jgi:hypothetical protein